MFGKIAKAFEQNLSIIYLQGFHVMAIVGNPSKVDLSDSNENAL